MKQAKTIWLLIAASLILIGCILFAGVMTTLGWDFTALATAKYETNTHTVSEAFDSISINTDTADIVFALSGDGTCRVVCHEQERQTHSVAVENGTLTVTLTDERTPRDYIGIHFGSPKITVYLPQREYDNLRIQESTGDIEIPGNFSFRRVEISVSTGNITISDVDCSGDITVTVSTGDVRLTDITCKNLSSKGNTGDISLINVIAEETLSIQRSTGDVKFDRCDAAEIAVTTDTGNVTGSLLSGKIFMAETDTGRVAVPESTDGGSCRITTDTGNIRITIAQP